MDLLEVEWCSITHNDDRDSGYCVGYHRSGARVSSFSYNGLSLAGVIQKIQREWPECDTSNLRAGDGPTNALLRALGY